MTLTSRRWFVCTALLIAAYTVVSLLLPAKGRALTIVGDIVPLVFTLLAAAVMTSNAGSSRGHTRQFWGLIGLGCFLWAVDQSLWLYYEVVRQQDVPPIFVGDIILFFHVVPFMAAVALRPHRSEQDQRDHFSMLNFFMLLVWWMFLYAFVVLPDEYLILNTKVYSRNFDLLYLVENLAWIAVLAILTMTTRGGWKKIYWNLFLAGFFYFATSAGINLAIQRDRYYTGCLYDVPFLFSICWLIWTGLRARELDQSSAPATPWSYRWLVLAPRLAMLATLSFPILGFWAIYMDTSEPSLRQFRLVLALTAMLVLGAFVLVRQFLLDRQLMRLLTESHQSLENLQRLHMQLVQKEKLASLGQLVSGAAHEINNPLAAILGYSELLALNKDLNENQSLMVNKIGQQARRTRDLVADLLRFAQQAPADKGLVDMGSMVQRALEMESLQFENKKISVETKIGLGLPRIWGNQNQLFQCCLQIIGNAIDALEEAGGGVLSVSVWQEKAELVLEFCDSGPGIREPQRVFDPFYTTKPVGKGPGLGLSATYGIIQNHKGQITCYNRKEGGAVFIVRFPAKQ